MDALLAEQDRVLVHAADPAIRDLTVARLAEQGMRAAPLSATPGTVTRSLARMGLALPGGLAAPEVAR